MSDGEHALVVGVDEGGVKSLAKVAQPEKGSECTAQWGIKSHTAVRSHILSTVTIIVVMFK